MNLTPRLARLGLLLALVLVALPAVPASADHGPPPGPVVSGTGNLQGAETVEEQEFTGSLCFRASRTVFSLRGAGTYHGRTTGGQEVAYKGEIASGQTLYADGPIQLEVENTATYYHGPIGTHGTADASCGPATAGTPAPAEFRMFVPDHLYRLGASGEQVPCVGQGRFARGQANDSTFGNPRWWAEWTLAEDCTVVGNEAGTPGTGVAKAGTAMTHHGTHEACFNPPCVSNFKVDYKQYAPVPGPYLVLSGPATARTGQNVTVTARFTNDGTPVADAPLTFSTTGPAPAAPPGATAVTGADGGATFTFTAVEPGDYTVSASTTHNAQVVSATHKVSFEPPPPLAVALAGPSSAQTEEDVRITATVTEGGDPAPAAQVEFSVAGPGQATPASASAITDTNGRAPFAFRADQAGDYTVTARATRLGQQASATHAVRLGVNTFFVAGSIPSEPGSKGSAVIDPAGDYTYFGTGTSPGRVVKIDLGTLERVGAITLNSGENYLQSAVIDPAGDYAYFGTMAFGARARVVKTDLNTFQRAGVVSFDADIKDLTSAVIDPCRRLRLLRGQRCEAKRWAGGQGAPGAGGCHHP